MMNTYIPEYGVLGWAVIVACFALVLWGAYSVWVYRRHRYVGFGWVLHWDETGQVTVLSRLLASPAGRSGIAIGDQLVSSQDQQFTGLTLEEFRAYFADHPVHVGDTRTYTLARKGTEESYSVTMVATKIQGPIQVYCAPPDHIRHNQRYKVGLCVCLKTGQPVSSVRLSDECVEELLNL